ETYYLSKSLNNNDIKLLRAIFKSIGYFNSGPAAITIGKDDIIYFSTKRLNSIVMFNPKTEKYFNNFPIPTAKSGQKDGITIDSKGIVWFTEFDKNKIARLRIIKWNDVNLPGKSFKNLSYKKGMRMEVLKTVSEQVESKSSKIKTFK
ncbi:MAG: hypothetical protein OEV44_02245, partial [Spirochaetota bacterium]|nr:hypothetical protein [Spirochaetota bacterium]